MKTIEYNLDQIDDIAKKYIKDISGAQVVTFVGDLGAGKTTFIKSVLHAMGVRQPVISPTFTYFNQYQASDGQMIYHFDLYRLKSMAEFEGLGFFEYLYQPDSIAFIEWPEIIDEALKESVCRTKLQVLGTKQRLLEYNCSK